MDSIASRTSWVVACTALAAMSVSSGARQVIVFGLRPIAESRGDAREVPSLAYSLAWIGTAVGGIAMGRIGDRVGVRWTVAFGSAMVAIGLLVASGGHCCPAR